MLPDCPSPPGQSIKCQFCGGKHETVSCRNLQASLLNHANIQNKNSQVYQVDINQNISSNNNQNWGNNSSWNNNNRPRRRNFNPNFNQGQNFNVNPNYINPNFNPNNFNNGGFSNNPNRGVFQMPTSNNQGWSQMPFGNVNQGPPTYGGQPSNWGQRQGVICYNCRQPGHYKSECPNAKTSEPYVPLCGNCGQAGHTATECNGPRKNEAQEGYNNKRRDNSPKLVLVEENKLPQPGQDRTSFLVQLDFKNQPKEWIQDKVVRKVSTRG